MSNLQVDVEKPKVCRACGAVDSQRVTKVRRRHGDTLKYWTCKRCGAHGVRICPRI